MFWWKRKKKIKEIKEIEAVMFLVVGLGNPERQYKNTRHNIGFETIDKLAYDHNISVNKSKHKGIIGTGNIAGSRVALVKPQTYMNLSGECVKAVLDFYKLTPANLIVVYDDVDLTLGEIRIRERGSAGGQNGMKNITAILATEEFTRVRVGIGPKPSGWDLSDYVLSRFKPEEHQGMIDGVTKAGEAIIKIITEGPISAMNEYNKKTNPKV